MDCSIGAIGFSTGPAVTALALVTAYMPGLAWWMAPFVLPSPLRTCLFYLGHIFESSTAIDSLEIGVGLKIDSGRFAARRLVSTALVLFCTPKPCF